MTITTSTPATTEILTATIRPPRSAGAIVAGELAGHIFALDSMQGMDAGRGYSTAFGPVIEGDRMQVGLIHKVRGTGAVPHSHPNEQWNYIVKGTLRVKISDEPEQLCGPGTVLYFPANIVHSTVATLDDDVIFFAVKDLSHGIHGRAVDGSMTKGYFESGA